MTTEEKAFAAAAALETLANEMEKKSVPAMRECVISMRAVSFTLFELYKMGMIVKESQPPKTEI